MAVTAWKVLSTMKLSTIFWISAGRLALAASITAFGPVCRRRSRRSSTTSWSTRPSRPSRPCVTRSRRTSSRLRRRNPTTRSKELAKTLAEIYQAKDAKTRLFVQKHVDAIQKRPDVAGNGDSLYKGANVKEFDREGNRMGYCKGVDDAKAGEWDPNHVAEDNFSVVAPTGKAIPGGTNINMAMAIAGRIARKDPKGNSYNVFQTRMNRTKMVRSVSRNGVTVTEDAPWVDVNEEVLDEKKRAKAPEYATSSNRYHGRGYWGSYGAGKIKEDGTGGPSDSQRDNEFA